MRWGSEAVHGGVPSGVGLTGKRYRGGELWHGVEGGRRCQRGGGWGQEELARSVGAPNDGAGGRRAGKIDSGGAARAPVKPEVEEKLEGLVCKM